MKKKTIICMILLLLLIVIGGFFYSYVKRDIALYNTEYGKGALSTVLTIDSSHPYIQSFSCSQNQLTGVKLMLSTVGEKSGTLQYCLQDESGNEVCDWKTIKISKLKSNQFTFLNLETQKESNGRQYTFILQSDSENAVAIAGIPEDGTVAFQYTYITWELKTWIVFVVCIFYLLFFIAVLVKTFRR